MRRDDAFALEELDLAEDFRMALKSYCTNAMVIGPSSSTTIDGEFDLREVARSILRKSRKGFLRNIDNYATGGGS